MSDPRYGNVRGLDGPDRHGGGTYNTFAPARPYAAHPPGVRSYHTHQQQPIVPVFASSTGTLHMSPWAKPPLYQRTTHAIDQHSISASEWTPYQVIHHFKWVTDQHYAAGDLKAAVTFRMAGRVLHCETEFLCRRTHEPLRPYLMQQGPAGPAAGAPAAAFRPVGQDRDVKSMWRSEEAESEYDYSDDGDDSGYSSSSSTGDEHQGLADAPPPTAKPAENRGKHAAYTDAGSDSDMCVREVVWSGKRPACLTPVPASGAPAPPTLGTKKRSRGRVRVPSPQPPSLQALMQAPRFPRPGSPSSAQLAAATASVGSICRVTVRVERDDGVVQVLKTERPSPEWTFIELPMSAKDKERCFRFQLARVGRAYNADVQRAVIRGWFSCLRGDDDGDDDRDVVDRAGAYSSPGIRPHYHCSQLIALSLRGTALELPGVDPDTCLPISVHDAMKTLESMHRANGARRPAPSLLRL